MRTRHAGVLAGVAMVLAAGAARAETPAIECDTPMPPITVPSGRRSLRDVLAEVQRAVPTFHCVIVTAPGVPDDVPKLPPMQLTDVTIGQFLLFLNASIGSVNVQQIDAAGGKPPLFVINVDAPRGRDAASPSPAEPTTAPPPPPVQHVRVVSLSQYVLPRAADRPGEGDHTREATDDVLSAVQAALDVAALPGLPATLKIHQPTMTLIVRGTDGQLDLIDETLASLRPTDEEAQAMYRSRADAEMMGQTIRTLNRKLDEAQRELAARPATRPAH